MLSMKLSKILYLVVIIFSALIKAEEINVQENGQSWSNSASGEKIERKCEGDSCGRSYLKRCIETPSLNIEERKRKLTSASVPNFYSILLNSLKRKTGRKQIKQDRVIGDQIRDYAENSEIISDYTTESNLFDEESREFNNENFDTHLNSYHKYINATYFKPQVNDNQYIKTGKPPLPFIIRELIRNTNINQMEEIPINYSKTDENLSTTENSAESEGSKENLRMNAVESNGEKLKMSSVEEENLKMNDDEMEKEEYENYDFIDGQYVKFDGTLRKANDGDDMKTEVMMMGEGGMRGRAGAGASSGSKPETVPNYPDSSSGQMLPCAAPHYPYQQPVTYTYYVHYPQPVLFNPYYPITNTNDQTFVRISFAK
ncbi:hypothetical protein O3M35_008731 [Rhynocoris fuscipes]|uniref:Uncharacterized protein n=1 Tax=Rhynocoris fuscipes TaxID=488301 RepID=A0AAW1DEP3_9HEMI